jgi:hypothetical protein
MLYNSMNYFLDSTGQGGSGPSARIGSVTVRIGTHDPLLDRSVRGIRYRKHHGIHS